MPSQLSASGMDVVEDEESRKAGEALLEVVSACYHLLVLVVFGCVYGLRFAGIAALVITGASCYLSLQKAYKDRRLYRRVSGRLWREARWRKAGGQGDKGDVGLP